MSSPQDMQAVDWSRIQQLLLNAAKHAPQIVAAVEMLLSLLAGQQPPTQASAVRCGPDGCDDPAECCCAAINAQVEALALMCQCHACCDQE